MVGRVVLNAPQGVGRRRPGDRPSCQERRAMKKEEESGPPMKFEEKMDKLDKIVKSMERGDMPLDDEHVGEDVYISVAEYAKEYAWYITPYLILTDEMIHALGLAAKRGVDVRVITPGIPDKPTVYSITRSYYQSLVRNGVRIFEYTPGFCHCKMSIADDAIATCGTINLDYRSLYHHFENGCLYAHCKAVMDTKKDFEATMAECREVTDQYRSPTAGKAFGQMILRLVAPLL